MTSRLTVKDYRGLTKLTPEQEQQLAAARLAAQQHLYATAAAQQLPAALQTPTPVATLNSGYDIPLVGLGTWWVLQLPVKICLLQRWQEQLLPISVKTCQLQLRQPAQQLPMSAKSRLL
jgi:hypothetical protein